MKPHAQIIYDALMRGERLTNQESKRLYSVEALSQRCGEISRDSSVPEVVSSKRVKGQPFNVHWIEGAKKSTIPNNLRRPIEVSSHTRKAPAKCEHTLEMSF